MKKSILFIIPSLASGGAEKSLINLLSVFDYSKYDVSLFLLKKEGLFLKSLPKEVEILNTSSNYKIFMTPLYQSVLHFLFTLKWKLAYHRILFTYINHKYTTNKAEQYSWKHLRKAVGQYPKEYDAAFGYMEKTSIYCCIDNFKAVKKIGFIRINYSKLGLDESFDSIYFNSLNYLCANGESSANVLKEIFPQHNKKIRKVLNVVSPSLIRKMATAFQPYDKNKINIISIGRLTTVKGYNLAINACAILVEKGYNICWSVIGQGIEQKRLETLISKLHLTDSFFLIGEKGNPYPYIKNADVFVHSSYYEGKSNTINEAKILAKPIVSTNFDFIYEQIDSGVNGLIVEKNAKAIAEGIATYLEDEILRKKVTYNLSIEKLGTEEEIERIYDLIES